MSHSDGSRVSRPFVLALLAVIGAAILAVGCFMIWMVVTPRGGITFANGTKIETVKGIATPLGVAAAIGAGVILVAAIVSVVWAERKRTLAGLTFFVSVVAVAVLVFFLLTIDSRFVAYASGKITSSKLPSGTAHNVVASLLQTGTAKVNPGNGPYVALLGAVLASIIGAAGVWLTRRRPEPVYPDWRQGARSSDPLSGAQPPEARPADSETLRTPPDSAS